MKRGKSIFLLSFAWGRDHPDWQQHTGAVGEAATLGGMAIETMFVPGGHWGANQLKEFGVVSQPQGVLKVS